MLELFMSMINTQVTPQNENEIRYLTAKECGVDIQVVNEVVNNFYKSLRFFISNPLISAKGILIHKNFKLEIKKFRLKKHIEKLDKSNDKYEFYTSLLDKLEN